MKHLMTIGLALTLALATYGCGGDETDVVDAGTSKDAGTKDSGTACPTEMCNGVCCPMGTSCNAGTQMCEVPCTPNCSGRVCGSDGCSGLCGACPTGQSCTAAGQCQPATCTPSCSGATCGP